MQVHRLIHAGMEQQEDVLREAPPILSDFFERISVPPLTVSGGFSRRDGRDTAISMSRHYVFRTVVATILALRRWGAASMARGRRC